MKTVALYLRVSTVDQHPQTQLHELRAMAQQRLSGRSGPKAIPAPPGSGRGAHPGTTTRPASFGLGDPYGGPGS